MDFYIKAYNHAKIRVMGPENKEFPKISATQGKPGNKMKKCNKREWRQDFMSLNLPQRFFVTYTKV